MGDYRWQQLGLLFFIYKEYGGIRVKISRRKSGDKMSESDERNGSLRDKLLKSAALQRKLVGEAAARRGENIDWADRSPSDSSHLANAGIVELIAQLKVREHRHEKVGKTLTEEEITTFESRTGFRICPSYRVFLKEFGNGATALYRTQGIDSYEPPSGPMKEYRYRAATAPGLVSVDGGQPIPRESLFTLMTQDSNGGAWLWLTSQPDVNGEYPLTYLMADTLFCKVVNFTEWLRTLVMNEEEVIRVLDKDDKCGLG